MVHQNKAPTAYPAVGAFILVARSEDENSCEGDRRLRRKQGARAGAAVAEDKPRPKGRRPMRAPQLVRRHRSAGTNSLADCWLARGRVPGEWEREQNVPGVEMLPLRSLTENVRLFFYCYNPESRAGAPSGTRTAAKATAPAAEAGSGRRGRGCRGGVPFQGAPADAGTATCRAPPPCVPAGKNGAVDHFRAQVPPQPDWPERGLYHPLRGGLMRRASACIRLAGTGR